MLAQPLQLQPACLPALRCCQWLLPRALPRARLRGLPARLVRRAAAAKAGQRGARKAAAVRPDGSAATDADVRERRDNFKRKEAERLSGGRV